MNFSHTSIDFSNRMICVIKDNLIYEMNTTGETRQIGHTNARFDELVNVANDYKKLCIENGLIEEEKTPEQIQMQMMAQMSEMMKVMQAQAQNINQLSSELEGLKNGYNETSNTGSKPVGRGQSKSKSNSNTSLAESTGSEQQE